MPVRLATGAHVEYPHVFYRNGQVIDPGELLHAYSQLFHQAQSLDHRLRIAEERIMRLEHENDFMLRLINTHCIGENDGSNSGQNPAHQ